MRSPPIYTTVYYYDLLPSTTAAQECDDRSAMILSHGYWLSLYVLGTKS